MSLGHEAHCSAGRHPKDKCCCLYPELEELRQEVIERQETEDSLLEWNENLAKRVVELENGMKKIMTFGADQTKNEMGSLIDCVELADELLKDEPEEIEETDE